MNAADEIECPKGVHIEKFASTLIFEAYVRNRPVVGLFNSIRLSARPGSTSDDVLTQYWIAECERAVARLAEHARRRG